MKAPRSRQRPRTKRKSRRVSPALSGVDGPLRAEAHEIDSLRQELERAASQVRPPRWNANPEDVQRSVIQLVLTLVEFIRKLMERQAIRRVEAHSLTRKQTEDVGLALMRLEETIHDIAAQFDLEPGDLNLDLGPVGKLM